jgi:hypothetical protein
MSIARAPRRLPVSDRAGDHVAHPLHDPRRDYPETNCYTDVVIELLHARGYEPLAVLGHIVRMDFEGDQWTFFKPPPADLERLYGIDIHEMQPYRPLPAQIAQQLAAGRTIIVELDSWFLPDTAATSYRTVHGKTSVAPDAIDPGAEWLRYFHNTGRHELAGEDYRGVFASERDGPAPPAPYTELVRFDAGEPLTGGALRDEARALLSAHLARRPRTDPFARFGDALHRDLPALQTGDLDGYHAYAFATVRMAGARSSCSAITCAGCSATTVGRSRQPPARSSTAARRCRSGSPGAVRSIPRLRSPACRRRGPA